MKKIAVFALMVCSIFGWNFAFAKDTELMDPQNNVRAQEGLTKSRGDYVTLGQAKEFNGMDWEIFTISCWGEDYLKTSTGGYAKTGTGEFVANSSGEYSKMTHEGVSGIIDYRTDIQEYCEYYCPGWPFCSCPGGLYYAERYKGYNDSEFENDIRPVPPDWRICPRASAWYTNEFIPHYQDIPIKNNMDVNSASISSETYWVYDGMITQINVSSSDPVFTLLTSIKPNAKRDLCVRIFYFDDEAGYYNAGVYDVFDCKTPYIKHTAMDILDIEWEEINRGDTETFKKLGIITQQYSFRGQMYYDADDKFADDNYYRCFIVCNNCSTCERCSTEKYDNRNMYVAYGEIPIFYLSRGCNVHACCFVYDYPVVLPDEYEGVMCPELKLEGDRYLACEAHTCQRWLEDDALTDNYSPQTCSRVVAGITVSDASTGANETRYTGPVDQGVYNGKIIPGGYSEYCAYHKCAAFGCMDNKENAEAFAEQYSKTENKVTMPGEFCTKHKDGCKVVINFNEQPFFPNSLTIAEQLQVARINKKYDFCSGIVSQSHYSFNQPDTLIDKSCYDELENGGLTKSGILVIGLCPRCGDYGTSLYKYNGSLMCASCMDFISNSVNRRNLDNYDPEDVKGEVADGECKFKIKRFANDTPVYCGEKCYDGETYCFYHKCDTEGCSNPVQYNGAYYCEKCSGGVCPVCGTVMTNGGVCTNCSGTAWYAETDGEGTASSEYDVAVNGEDYWSEDYTSRQRFSMHSWLADWDSKFSSSSKDNVKKTSEVSEKNVNSSELTKRLSSGQGVVFTYKGKTIELTNEEALSFLNMLDNESDITEAQATAVAQVALNNYLNGNKSFASVINNSFSSSYTSGSNSSYDKSGTMNYSENALNALSNIVNDNEISKQVTEAIGNSITYAGYSDAVIGNNLVEAEASYIENGQAYSTEGTILEDGVGSNGYGSYVFSEVFPTYCPNCGKGTYTNSNGTTLTHYYYLDANGYCANCGKTY